MHSLKLYIYKYVFSLVLYIPGFMCMKRHFYIYSSNKTISSIVELNSNYKNKKMKSFYFVVVKNFQTESTRIDFHSSQWTSGTNKTYITKLTSSQGQYFCSLDSGRIWTFYKSFLSMQKHIKRLTNSENLLVENDRKAIYMEATVKYGTFYYIIIISYPFFHRTRKRTFFCI